MLGATLKAGETTTYRIGVDRHGYMVPSTGAIEVNGVRLGTRDGAAISKEETVTVKALEDSEVVFVDAA